ncbi:hypothetical protein BFC17_15300 [Alteromonas lipolytica]|uniref:HTH araC/xylS-type domain-containing protein n=2 Tax=Alteromonas lipolytica TaxID=1856405 RepID=A0A1E8FG78_9ALTE|nr:hypothetical protein BFC17_15300 [Alteromonas lipolytica]
MLWHKQGHKGICLYLLLIAIAALFNIIEGIYFISDTFLITPVFQLLFGPALFLACVGLIHKKTSKIDALHFFPAIISIPFTNYVQIIIALGTISRIGYSVLTALKLYSYKKSLDLERSDSDEYSFQWMIAIIAITAVFNLLDLIRLNFQPYIAGELNLIGQAFNNGLWLVAIIFITYKLNEQKSSPSIKDEAIERSSFKEDSGHFLPIYSALDNQVKEEQLYKVSRLTLNQLSELTGLQPRDISRAINLNANKSFNEYINDLRVDYVCNILRSGAQKSITDLAFEAGFSSKAVFNRAFKQVTGMTPSRFKNQQ